MGRVIHGDCIEEMRELDENSVDAVVTDPPYGLAFMGKSWDDFEPKEYQTFCEEWGEQALRVLKPGGHLLAFSGTRTYHRMVVGLEDAGFQIRDMVAWMYGSGFPKGHDISKAIDKHKGEEREVVGEKIAPDGKPHSERVNKEPYGSPVKEGDKYGKFENDIEKTAMKTAPATEEAQRWDGWNTALKPAHEPVVVAQKPRRGTYAENVLEWGVGGLNIDACRITINDDSIYEFNSRGSDRGNHEREGMFVKPGKADAKSAEKGRWPGNVVLDRVAAAQLDRQTGELESGVLTLEMTENADSKPAKNTYGEYKGRNLQEETYGDSGGASRFFYCAKARKSERNAGLSDDNDIATLKPINLMRWLVRLVTPENGTVLDPFAGSGTTGCACEIEGFNYILIEERERFTEQIIPRRLEYWADSGNWGELKDHNELPKTVEKRNTSVADFA